MKKPIKTIIFVICAVFAALSLAACSDPGAPEHSVKNPNYAVQASAFESALEKFMNGRENRTSYTAYERAAAEYINAQLIEYGYDDSQIIEFNAKENNHKLGSQNVVAHYRAKNSSNKTPNVIIGAYYDNRYDASYTGGNAYKSDGALLGGSGVATLLVIAEYFQTRKVDLDFDITFAFFGASYLKSEGANSYVQSMDKYKYENTVLMIEIQRIGVDHVYAFSDVRETKREPFFAGIASKNCLDIYKPTTKSPQISEYGSLNGIPFFQWAHNGVFGAFFNEKIPTLNIVGANWETVSFDDRESIKHDNISFTHDDTLSNLKHMYPDYGEKMATAATLVIRSIEDPEFLRIMQYDREHFPDTSVLNNKWIWYLVVFGFTVLCGGVLALVNRHLARKYRPQPPVAPPSMKMAVFGMDYEESNSADVFIDIGSSVQDEIFPGVNNNERANPFEATKPINGADKPAPDKQISEGETNDNSKNTPESPKRDEHDATDNDMDNDDDIVGL